MLRSVGLVVCTRTRGLDGILARIFIPFFDEALEAHKNMTSPPTHSSARLRPATLQELFS